MYQQVLPILFFFVLHLGREAFGDRKLCEGPDGHGNLPWDDYEGRAMPVEERASNEMVTRYRGLEDICCDIDTAFTQNKSLMMWDYPFVRDPKYTDIDLGTQHHCQFIWLDMDGGSVWDCKRTCYRFYQEFVMGVSDILCLSALFISTLPNCTYGVEDPTCDATPACAVYNVLPVNYGGGERCTAEYDDQWTRATDYFIKPECVLTQDNHYHRQRVRPAVRQECRKTSLPWSDEDLARPFPYEPINELGGIRMNLFTKLHEDCCSKETALTYHFGRKYRDVGPCGKHKVMAPFLQHTKWDKLAPTGEMRELKEVELNVAMAEWCQTRCYEHFEKWILGKVDNACHSAMMHRVDKTDYFEYHCRLYSKARYDKGSCPMEEVQKKTYQGKYATDEYGKNAIIELREQCTMERDPKLFSYSSCIETVGSQPEKYQSSLCTSLEKSKRNAAGCNPAKCQGFSHYRGTIFIQCLTPNTTMYIESVRWWIKGKQIDPSDRKGFIAVTMRKHFLSKFLLRKQKNSAICQ